MNDKDREAMIEAAKAYAMSRYGTDKVKIRIDGIFAGGFKAGLAHRDTEHRAKIAELEKKLQSCREMIAHREVELKHREAELAEKGAKFSLGKGVSDASM